MTPERDNRRTQSLLDGLPDLIRAAEEERERDLVAIKAAGFGPFFHPEPSPHFQIPPGEWERLKPPPVEPSPLSTGVIAPLGGYPVFIGECPCKHQIPLSEPTP